MSFTCPRFGFLGWRVSPGHKTPSKVYLYILRDMGCAGFFAMSGGSGLKLNIDTPTRVSRMIPIHRGNRILRFARNQASGRDRRRKPASAAWGTAEEADTRKRHRETHDEGMNEFS
jgi:hypothetical protein